MAKTTSISGYAVRVPKSGLSSRQRSAISARLSNPQGLKKDKKCVLIAFKSGGVAQRCEGRTLAKNATAAQKRARAAFAKAARSCRGKGKAVGKCVAAKL